MASAKVEKQGSFGSKRSRNNTSRSDGDWTCHQCGNVNFSFRTVCNRSQCGAPRSAASPRMGSTPVRGGFDQAPSLYFGGIGAPPPLPIGLSRDYGGPLSLSGGPLSLSGLRYDYGPGSASGPYGLLSPYGPPSPYGGMGYGPRPGMDRYGYPFRGSPLPVPGPWASGDLPDNNGSRKRRGGPDGIQEGDWICPKCENVNFSFRTACNMKKCGAPRPNPAPPKAAASGNQERSATPAPEGSWTCTKCGNLNYPFRTVCNRKGCGSDKLPASK